jgi:diaminopimelate decarboxylase
VTGCRFTRDGAFEMDGVALDSVLKQQATPFYLYSAETIRSQYQRLSESFPGFHVCYSFKANPNPEVCRLLQRTGAGAEVSSLRELHLALQTGFRSGDIVFVGPAKTGAEIELAVRSGIGALVVDSAEELVQVDKLAESTGAKPRVLLRINTTEKMESFERMVGGPSKFGFDEEEVVAQAGAVRPAAAVVAGIQVYSASGVLDARFLVAHLEYVFRLAKRLSRELRFKLEMIDFGGGFGVPYREGEDELDLRPVAAAARRLKQEYDRDVSGCRFVFESGRYLVAQSGVFVTRVERVKESRGRLFVITDSGMNGFSRPAFMRVPHQVVLLNRLTEPAEVECDVCGPICTPLDCIGKGVRLPRPKPGDIVGVLDAGAYGYTMTIGDFMSRGWPAELLVDSGHVRVIREPR